MTTRLTQGALLVAARSTNLSARATTVALLVASGPPTTRSVRAAMLTLLAATQGHPYDVTRLTELAMLLATGEGVPVLSLSHAWTFTFDGHTFYVLNLGNVGTFVYDTVTQQWSNFSTAGYEPTWNMMYGWQWDQRVVGFDAVNPELFEIDPSATLDEGFRDIIHTVTGFLAARTRIRTRVDNLRVSGSIGFLDEGAGATLNMTFSDDNGVTWHGPFTAVLQEGSKFEIAYRSLGSFAAPGRVFQFQDVGGLVRIDGADVFLNSFDEAQQAATPPQSVQQRGPGQQQ